MRLQLTYVICFPGYNPQTGKAIKIKAKEVPKFTAGKALKNAVK
jgi:nucleoid DNA-binding protein